MKNQAKRLGAFVGVLATIALSFVAPAVRPPRRVDGACRPREKYFGEARGSDPKVEITREHPLNLLEYFLPKAEVDAKGMMPKSQRIVSVLRLAGVFAITGSFQTMPVTAEYA